jgi:hypothetical protein
LEALEILLLFAKEKQQNNLHLKHDPEKTVYLTTKQDVCF